MNQRNISFLLALGFLLAVLAFPPEASCRTGDKGKQKAEESGKAEVTELWTGKVLTASFRAGMCFGADGKARGVLILRHANGKEDPYHLYGRIRSNAFDLSHSSGHSFTGKITGPSSMEGRVKLKNGLVLNLKGKRKTDVPLAKDCAPLSR